MKSNYKKLGTFVHAVDERNSSGTLGADNLFGLSVTKEFIATHANLVGVTFDSYKVVRPRQFAYIPDTSRRGDKIAIALNTIGDTLIVSSICTVFEIVDERQLLPEYLMLWFMRPEFDRYARFMSNGSAREVFDWENMCGVELPIPPIEEQRKIVHDYQVVANRIELLQKIEYVLEMILYTDFQNKFQAGKFAALNGTPHDGWRIAELSSLTDFQYGKMVPEGERCESGYPIFSGYGITGYYHEYMFENPCIVVLARGVSGTGKVRISPKYSYITNLSIALILKDDTYFAYLYEYLAHDNLRALDSGSAQSMITIDSLNKYLVAIPPKEIAEEYNNSFNATLTTIETNRQEIEILSELASLHLNMWRNDNENYANPC